MLIEFHDAEEPGPVGDGEEAHLMCFKSCSFRTWWLFSLFFFFFFNLKPDMKRSHLRGANDSHELFLLIYTPTLPFK